MTTRQPEPAGPDGPDAPPAELRRAIGALPLALYGIGVTVGAGIYVLVGEVARLAGPAAPLSFLLAALVLAPTAFSYAELSVRFPRSAGEAVYVSEAFGALTLTRAVGLLVAIVGIVSSAAVAIGAAGYVRQFVDVPAPALAVGLVLVLGAVCAWGVVQSVALAVVISLVEVGALVWIVAIGAPLIDDPLAVAGAVWPAAGEAAWSGIGAGLLVAFFAFVGFEDIVNMAEETKAPERTMPRAIALTLIVTMAIYFAVVFVAVAVVGADALAGSEAPLALVYVHASGGSPALISAIAVASTLNTVLIQMIMASRVLYGMAREGALPAALGRVHPLTRTPLVATALAVAVIVLLVLLVPIGDLARATSALVLVAFVAVNLALVRLKRRRTASPGFSVPLAVPVAGALISAAVLAQELARILL